MGYLQQYSFWLLKKLFEKPLDPKFVCVCVFIYIYIYIYIYIKHTQVYIEIDKWQS